MEAYKRQQYGKTGTSYSKNNRASYIEGNTVRKLYSEPVRREDEEYEIPSPGRQEHRQERRQTKAISGINFASLLVLTLAIAATVYVCIDFLKLQYDVSRMEKSIVTLENDLSTQTKKNDAAYEEINKTYDLKYVYHVAVEELGMVYPNKNKVITYQSSEDDFVRQYEDIPD